MGVGDLRRHCLLGNWNRGRKQVTRWFTFVYILDDLLYNNCIRPANESNGLTSELRWAFFSYGHCPMRDNGPRARMMLSLLVCTPYSVSCGG